MRDNWRRRARTPGLGYKRRQLTQGARQGGLQKTESHVSKPSQLSNMKPWSYTCCNFGLVGGPGFPSMVGSFNKQLPVCYVVMIIWGCGRCGRRNVSIEGEIPYPLSSGSSNYSGWASDSQPSGEFLFWRRVWLHLLESAPREQWVVMGLNKPFDNLLQCRNKHSRGSGNLTRNQRTWLVPPLWQRANH